MKQQLTLFFFLFAFSLFAQKSHNYWELTQIGNKVYVEGDNEKIIFYATQELKKLDYWKITRNASEADFILRFKVRFNFIREAFGYVEFLNKDYESFSKTAEVNTIMSSSLSVTKAVIKKIVRKDIKPIFKEEYELSKKSKK